MNIGDIYIQRHLNMDIYVMPTVKLENGYHGLFYQHVPGTTSQVMNAKLSGMKPSPSPMTGGTPKWILDKFREAQ